MVRRGLLTLIGLVAATAALAQGSPRLVPSRDVRVTYKAASGRTFSVAFSAALQRFRMEEGGQVMLTDAGATEVTTLTPARRLAERDDTLGAGLPWSSTLKHVRRGTDTVLGMRCTEWRATRPRIGEGGGSSYPYRPTDLCVTADGIVLRSRDARTRAVDDVVTAVSFNRQDPSRFQVPPGYASR